MVSEHKSPHGANNQSVCCNATLTLDHGKNDKYIIAIATQTDKLLPQTTLMTNQLTAVINNTTSINNAHLKSVNKHNSTYSTHKSAENVTAIEHVPESLVLTSTAPVTPILGNKTQLQSINNRTAVANDTNGRSAALERAYVHDVYEQCEEQTGAIRPRVANFLSCLDPGSIVCDVGCGNGRYLTQCNPAIVTIGVDRCQRLNKAAKERGGEVLLSDNLELPFISDSFDAVLSLSVIHHFATTERRVNALRELARILRIGGRVIITVWALEQKNRRFDSQDVLIPWQPPKTVPHYYSDEEDDDEFLPHYNAYTEESTNSSRSTGDGDSSSLSSSSPGESCYGFMRRALQKLTARKQGWFQESWTSKDTKTSSIDLEDARDLPIELRRLDDLEESALTVQLKTRSLSSILNPPPRQIVRSRSSVPSLAACSYTAELKTTPTSTQVVCTPPATQSNNSLNRRPKLIKQKQSLCDEDFAPSEPCIHMISSIETKDNSINHVLTETNTQNSLRKQSSFNEELMAGNRLREKERVRKRIQKQTSLNEAFLCRSALFSKRLQVIREEFTSSFKSSKGNLERATKNGINKIIQNIKETQVTSTILKTDNECKETAEPNCPQHQHQHHHHQNPRPTYTAGPYGSYFVHMLQRQLTANTKNVGGPVIYCNNTDCLSSACFCSTYQHGCPQCLQNEDQARRHSHESGSDSSKDGSLQSDTSVESEDSFASVIYIPKPEFQQQQHQQQQFKQQHQNSNSSSSNSSSSNGGCQLHNNKNYSCGCIKPMQQQHQQQQLQQKQQICVHANTIQLQQHHHHHRHLSSAPTSPLVMPCPPTPAHSPAAAQMSVTSPPQTMAAVTAAMALLTSPNKSYTEDIERKLTKTTNCFNFDEAHLKQQQQEQFNEITSNINVKIEEELHTVKKSIVVETKKPEREYKSPPKITRQSIQNLPAIPSFRKQQSLQILRSNFPIVRSSSTTGALITTNVPRLLTLELFNPATDDLDSDSSEASSPDSVDSVISAHKSFSSTNEDSELPPEINTKPDSNESDEEAFNLELNTDTSLTENILSKRQSVRGHSSLQPKTQAECAKFAEQLSAKLLECEKNSTHGDFVTLENVSDPAEYVEECLSAGTEYKKRNKSDHNDTISLKEELRERRLMLANLSTQPSLQQSPTSSSTSSLSSHTRSSYDEDGERSYMLHLYENCKMSKLNNKKMRLNNIHPELAQLIQDDSDFSAREDYDDYEHDVILEEDEEAVAAAEQEQEIATKLTNNNVPLQVTNKAEQKPHLEKEDSAFVEHSNSSSDIDSPSQDGSTTHHRYFHVFREGELDSLINNHVSSLHIVSSFYERSSWCVIAEKVHVWTI